MTAFATHLHEGDHLRPGLTVDEALDLLWTISSPEQYELLVLERGWTLTQYRDFLAGALTALLL